METFLEYQVRKGHGHSDFDSDEDLNPWDEYNKSNSVSYLERKIQDQFSLYPEINLSAKIPYLDRQEGKAEKENPQFILQKQVKREYLKQMALVVNPSDIKMDEEAKIFKRYLRMSKKLAYSIKTQKQQKNMEPLFSRADYSEFDHFHFKQSIAMDLDVFEDHCNFDVESLDSESIRKKVKVELLHDMLAKKPHYARFFTELEDELTDTGFLAQGMLQKQMMQQ